ncbi:MAG TPA: MFS transporter, partial [Chitinophagaceae bacterium]|nr:MFS transporter [Chitinophagaceae bacterium]
NMRGRVMSVNSMFINSSNELGQFESGVAAKLMGVVPSVIFGGCMTIGVVVATWFKAPTLRKMQY